MPLMEALTQEDRSNTAIAIFIEWHRRDPVAAMNEIAARPSWSRGVLSKLEMVLYLTPDVLLNQLNARNRSSDFKEAVIETLAVHWVNTDELRSLSARIQRRSMTVQSGKISRSCCCKIRVNWSGLIICRSRFA